MFDSRITILAGHFGSGKSEIAINGAIDAARAGSPVFLADLDVVKPYFRSRAARQFLEDSGVTLVAPKGENVYADLPILLPEVRGLCADSSRKLIMDVGGDDMGVRVLGALNDVIPPDETAFYLVLNFRRPFTPDVAAAVQMARQIEAPSRLRFTGLIANTHLMDETTPDVVLDGYRLALETGHELDLPVVAVTAAAPVSDSLPSEGIDCPVFVLNPMLRAPFRRGPEVRKTGPIFVLN
ncbi:MAG: cobalamin biosynthesis protein CbiA [Acidobacteriota bacterium]|jgi:hypothetical protein